MNQFVYHLWDCNNQILMNQDFYIQEEIKRETMRIGIGVILHIGEEGEEMLKKIGIIEEITGDNEETNIMTEINKINSDEFELYDRQIRLWGLDAQNRLRQSSVIIVGMTGLGAELAKNLMLSGLRSLTLMDDMNISDADRHSQFLISPNDRGNRAQASIERLKQLNPMVQVNVENGSISSKSEDFFKNFDLVILVDQNFDITNKIDKICRKYKIRFQAGGVFGWIGYGFFDFNDHIFLVPKPKEAQIIQSILDDVDERIEDISESKKLRTEDGNIQTFTLEDEDAKIKKNVLFPSFEQTFDIKLGMKKLLRRRFSLPSTYYIIRAFMQIMKEKNGDDYTKDEVIKKWKKELEEACLEESKQKFTVDDFALFTKPALNSVCAIVGSVLAQEAIKALSQNDAPLKNIFLYSPVDSSGTVCEIPA